MRTCKHCEAPLAEDSRFCHACGRPVMNKFAFILGDDDDGRRVMVRVLGLIEELRGEVDSLRKQVQGMSVPWTVPGGTVNIPAIDNNTFRIYSDTDSTAGSGYYVLNNPGATTFHVDSESSLVLTTTGNVGMGGDPGARLNIQ